MCWTLCREFRRDSKSRRRSGTATQLELAADLARVHDRLAATVAEEPVLYDRDLVNYIVVMIGDGTVSLNGAGVDSAADVRALAEASLDPFLRAAAFLFDRLEDDERAPELGRRFRLREAPPASMPVMIRVNETLVGGELEWIEVRTPLHELLTGILGGDDAEKLIRFVSADPEGRGLVPLPRRAIERPSRAPRPQALALHGNRLTTLSAAVQPSVATAAPAHTLLLTQSLQPYPAAIHVSSNGAPQNEKPLPILQKGSEPPWPDRIDAKKKWYLPELVPVVPEATAAPDAAPFRFTFRTTGHDLAGRPGLEASIRITLQKRMPEAVARELERLGNDVTGEAVVAKNLSVELEIPFRNERGETIAERFRSVTVESNANEITATFELLDDWARVAYGALAQAGFQSQPARISVAYRYEGYTATSTGLSPQLLFGGKRVSVPLALGSGRNRPRGSRALDPRTGVVYLEQGGQLKLPAIKRQRSARPRVDTVNLHVATPVLQASALTLRPQALPAPALVDALRRTEYVEVQRIERADHDVRFLCSDLGGLYLEERAGDDGTIQRIAIGCRPAFQLGQTEHRLYEEVALPPELRAVGRVYRSLQSPGRFVFAPDSYRITRFGPADGDRAFRPSVLLYSTVDIDDLSKSRCVIMSTLQLAASEAEIARLVDHLRRHEHTAARLELLTEVAGDVSFEWALPTGASELLRLEASSLRTPSGFEVSLATDAFGLPQLQEILSRSGISGTATLTLPDGTRWLTTLRLHLAQVVGPASPGPLELEISSEGSVTLRNRIESTVLVSDLLLLDEDDMVIGTAPAELRVEPDALETVALSSVPARALPLYTVESTASSLVEIRSFIEDITVAVLVHNRIDLEDFEIAKLDVEVRVQGVAGVQRVDFTSDGDVAQTIRFLLPLTSYLASPSLELHVSLTAPDGSTRPIDPIPWRLGADGYIVSMTPSLLGLQ